MYVHVLTDASIHVYMHAYTNREGAPGTTSQVLRIKREETRSFGKVGLFSRTSCRAHTPGCACVWYVYVYVYEYEYGCRNGCVDEFMHLHVYMSSYHFYPFPSSAPNFLAMIRGVSSSAALYHGPGTAHTQHRSQISHLGLQVP